MESGVELADTLSEQLKLPSNGTKLSRARRDKYEMVEAKYLVERIYHMLSILSQIV